MLPVATALPKKCAAHARPAPDTIASKTVVAQQRTPICVDASAEQACATFWRPVPRVAAAAQVAVALAPRRAELAVGQRHAVAAAEVRLRAVEVAAVARASLSAAPAREPQRIRQYRRAAQLVRRRAVDVRAKGRPRRPGSRGLFFGHVRLLGATDLSSVDQAGTSARMRSPAKLLQLLEMGSLGLPPLRKEVRSLAILAAMRLQTRTVLLASELGKHPLRSISLTHGADHLDARGRSPMCRQSSRPSLGGEAGGRPGFDLSFIFSAPLRSFTMKHASLLSSTVQGNGKRRSGIASPVLARERASAALFVARGAVH